jgi:hypothetical protein
MKSVLSVAYQVVYYNENGRQVYWPVDTRSDVLAKKLREARGCGLNARLSQAEVAVIRERKAA